MMIFVAPLPANRIFFFSSSAIARNPMGAFILSIIWKLAASITNILELKGLSNGTAQYILSPFEFTIICQHPPGILSFLVTLRVFVSISYKNVCG